jgi:hypothetical protein
VSVFQALGLDDETADCVPASIARFAALLALSAMRLLLSVTHFAACARGPYCSGGGR